MEAEGRTKADQQAGDQLGAQGPFPAGKADRQLPGDLFTETLTEQGAFVLVAEGEDDPQQVIGPVLPAAAYERQHHVAAEPVERGVEELLGPGPKSATDRRPLASDSSACTTETKETKVAAMAKVPTAAVAASGLVGGYGIARWTGKRPLGGVALAAAGSVAAYGWNRQAGTGAAVGLTVAYVAAFAGSHPLAKKVGAWPAVFAVAGGVAAASWAVTRRGA